MEHFDELVTDRAIRLDDLRRHMADSDGTRYLGRYWVNVTSGSSGHPGLFLFNTAEWMTVLASFARGREWAGVRTRLMGRMTLASVASLTPWHMSAQIATTVQSWWMPTLRLAASAPLTEIVHQLNTWQPQMLVAYASMAQILAEEQHTGRLHITPELVFTSSEVLMQSTRRHVAAAWGQEPFNQYAATETAGIAAEQRDCRRMHLFEDLVIVEIVDADNRPVPPGVYGDKLLMTTLWSRTQPLIRYELSDRIRLAVDPCTCGHHFRVIDGIEGRVEDLLQLPDLMGRRLTIHPNVFHEVMDTVPSNDWQVRQEANGLRVLVSTSETLDEAALCRALQKALVAQGASIPALAVQRVAAIPKTAAGKAPLIIAYQPTPEDEMFR